MFLAKLSIMPILLLVGLATAFLEVSIHLILLAKTNAVYINDPKPC